MDFPGLAFPYIAHVLDSEDSLDPGLISNKPYILDCAIASLFPRSYRHLQDAVSNRASSYIAIYPSGIVVYVGQIIFFVRLSNHATIRLQKFHLRTNDV